MKLILIDDHPESRAQLYEILDRNKAGPIWEAPSLQDGIEALESSAESVTLVVCNYRGTSKALTVLLLELSASIPCILFTDTDYPSIPREAALLAVKRDDVAGFKAIIEQLRKDGFFNKKTTADADFVRVDATNLTASKPLKTDLYLRLAPNRYCKRFHGKDVPNPSELEEYAKSHKIAGFYVKKDQVAALIASQADLIDAMNVEKEVALQTAQDTAAESLELIHNVVDQLGFTLELQELAKQNVSLLLKAFGDSPAFSDVLKRMRQHEGKYITAHSVMLAEVACAIAHKIGQGSESTFLKLTLSAVLHDITLTSNKLARRHRLEEITAANGFTAHDAHFFKLHPVKAAEYSRQLQQLPSDVDTIIIQHHEQPDGSGFPRGLRHHQINHLACIFIVAHDLLDYFLAIVPPNNRDDILRNFLDAHKAKYADGTLYKISQSLRTGEPLKL